MSDFTFHELFPLGEDQTPYRKLSADFVGTASFNGMSLTTVEPQALTMLAREAYVDCQHLLRPGHLQQLRNILDDPEASDNDRFVAFDLLKNANIAAGKVLPMCQDTGTAIVMGKKGQRVWTGGDDEAALSRRHLPHVHRDQSALFAASRRSTCSRRTTPATICRRRSISTPPRATNTTSSSSPRAAARRTRASSSSRRRRC